MGAPYGSWCFAEIAGYQDAPCATMDAEPIFFGLDFCTNLTRGYTAATGVDGPRATFVCDTSTQTPTLPPARWTTAAVGCAQPTPPVDGCGSGQICAPLPTAPFGGHACVSSPSDEACPQQTYTTKSLYYTGTLDSRSCTACGYDPSVISCTGTAVMYSDSACTDELEEVTDFSQSCRSLPDGFTSTTLLDASFTGTPSCTPTGGAPNGTLAAVGPVTVCCTP